MSGALKPRQRVRDFLLADSRLVAKISDRFWAMRSPQSERSAYVVWQNISGSDIFAHDGPTQNEEFRLQFSIFAPTAQETYEIRDIIKDRINGISGVLVDVRIGFCFFDNDIDGIADEAGLIQKTIDFRVSAARTI